MVALQRCWPGDVIQNGLRDRTKYHIWVVIWRDPCTEWWTVVLMVLMGHVSCLMGKGANSTYSSHCRRESTHRCCDIKAQTFAWVYLHAWEINLYIYVICMCAKFMNVNGCLPIGALQIAPDVCISFIMDMESIDESKTRPLQWRHNGRGSGSNHQPHDCFLNRLFRHRSKKTSKLRVTGLCAGNSPEAGEFPAQMASNAENVSIWWRHHAYMVRLCKVLGMCWMYMLQNIPWIICMRPANERRRYIVTPSLIGWMHTQNDSRCTQFRQIFSLLV